MPEQERTQERTPEWKAEIQKKLAEVASHKRNWDRTVLASIYEEHVSLLLAVLDPSRDQTGEGETLPGEYLLGTLDPHEQMFIFAPSSMIAARIEDDGTVRLAKDAVVAIRAELVAERDAATQLVDSLVVRYGGDRSNLERMQRLACEEQQKYRDTLVRAETAEAALAKLGKDKEE